MLTTTSELAAVNIMLATIGESPINALSSISGVPDAVTAQSILEEIAVVVQTEGWAVNEDNNWLFLPDVTGTITLPDNLLQVTTVDQVTYDTAMRGGRLYDKLNHTFTWTGDVANYGILLNTVTLMEFADLPQALRYYITVRAARVFQSRVVGSDTLKSFTSADEALARVNAKKYDADTGEFNFLSGSIGIVQTLQR